MSDLAWSPDGEQMFAKLMEAIPEAMRDMIKPKLMEMLASKASGKTVTAEIVTRMIQEDLPEPQKTVIMQTLNIKKSEKKPEPNKPEQPASQEVPSIQWTGRSENMFEIMLGEVPEAMRDVFRGKLLGVISEKSQGGPVSEDHITGVVNEIVPEPFKSNILKKFKAVGDFDLNIIDDIISRSGTSQDKLMYILNNIQDEIGYLPIEALQAVSDKCALPISTIYNIVTFYKIFKLTPPGTHQVKLCQGTACHLKDNHGLLKEIEEKISGSLKTTLEKTLCLGCCDCAPVVEIDGRLYKGDDAKSKIDEITT
jgi:NADH:ubiquinone oxidoreductase subunit E